MEMQSQANSTPTLNYFQNGQNQCKTWVSGLLRPDSTSNSHRRYRPKNYDSGQALQDIPSGNKLPFAQTYHLKQYQKGESPDTCQSDRSHRSDVPEQTNKSKINHNKLKVELCKNFIAKGYCPYENRCRFAHGLNELRAQAPQHSDLYRTRPCKTFLEFGHCRFGDRCNFLHSNFPQRTGLKKAKGHWGLVMVEVMMQIPQEDSRLLNLLGVEPKVDELTENMGNFSNNEQEYSTPPI